MIPKSGTGFRKRSCSSNKLERDDDSKNSHPALGAAAFAPAAPLHGQSWKELSVNWQADVKIAFHSGRNSAALQKPIGAPLHADHEARPGGTGSASRCRPSYPRG